VKRFKDKVAVVTGGAAGIGAAAARRFLVEGARVVVGDITDAAVSELSAAFGEEQFRSLRADVSDWASVENLMAEAGDAFGGIDILVNNAGVGFLGSTLQTSLADWRRMMSINLDGVFHGCRAGIPYLQQRGGGAIVNIASISGIAGDYNMGAYNATKGAVINFSRSVALELATEGIRVNVVCPGPTETALTQGIERFPGAPERWRECVPMGRLASPEEIAAVIAFLCSADASFMTGAIVPVDGGVTAGTGQPNLLDFAPPDDPRVNRAE
jgi:meso-butanediol dehydrogenase/(S,S)-butanediol dehydrogenase/diacetyl reductase